MKVVTHPETAAYSDDLSRIVQEAFGNLPVEHVGTKEIWHALEQACPELDVIAVDNGQAIGFLTALPVTPAAAELIRTGALRDGEFTPAHLAKSGDPFSLYVVALAVTASWRGKGISNALWNAMVSLWLPRRPERVFGTIWSPAGAKFCKPLQIAEIGVDREGHPVVSLQLKLRDPAPPRDRSSQ